MRNLKIMTRGQYSMSIDMKTGEVFDPPMLVETDINFVKANFAKILEISSKLTTAENSVFWKIITIAAPKSGHIRVTRDKLVNLTGKCKNIVDKTIAKLIEEDFMRKCNADEYYINPNIICYGGFNLTKNKAYEGLRAPKKPFSINLISNFYKVWIKNVETMLWDSSRSDNKLLAYLFCNCIIDEYNTVKIQSLPNLAKNAKISEKTLRKSLNKQQENGFLLLIGNKIMFNPDCVSHAKSEYRLKVINTYKSYFKRMEEKKII